jgi:hypothetical protein
MTRHLPDGDPLTVAGLAVPPRPLISKLHELCLERSSGEAAIDVVLELLRLGETFSAKPFVMPP